MKHTENQPLNICTISGHRSALTLLHTAHTENNHCDHKLVILLSDAKPNDVIRMQQGNAYVDYAGYRGFVEVNDILPVEE